MTGSSSSAFATHVSFPPSGDPLSGPSARYLKKYKKVMALLVLVYAGDLVGFIDVFATELPSLSV